MRLVGLRHFLPWSLTTVSKALFRIVCRNVDSDMLKYEDAFFICSIIDFSRTYVCRAYPFFRPRSDDVTSFSAFLLLATFCFSGAFEGEAVSCVRSASVPTLLILSVSLFIVAYFLLMTSRISLNAFSTALYWYLSSWTNMSSRLNTTDCFMRAVTRPTFSRISFAVLRRSRYSALLSVVLILLGTKTNFAVLPSLRRVSRNVLVASNVLRSKESGTTIVSAFWPQ